MRNLALLLAAGAAALAVGTAAEARSKQSGEQQLAKLLEGRIAGQPVDCISIFDSRDQRVIDKTAIVYGHGNTIYVNRPSNARNLDDDDILVSNIHGSQICNLDVVRLHDRSGGFYNGFVGLEQFVPYRKVAMAD
jgi:hypothetical protein